MGFLGKLLNGDARHFKVYRRCDSCSDTSVYVVTTKSGRDLVDLAKHNPEAVMKEVYDGSCHRCVLNVDEIAEEDIKKAKKIYTTKVID